VPKLETTKSSPKVMDYQEDSGVSSLACREIQIDVKRYK